MFDKKKLNFWRLAFIFIGYTGITLLSLWVSPYGKKASMMNESMANMSKMHLDNVTIYDLVGNPDTGTQTKPPDTSQHHEGIASDVKAIAVVTTLIIFSLLPLLIFGTIILAIIWIK